MDAPEARTLAIQQSHRYQSREKDDAGDDAAVAAAGAAGAAAGAAAGGVGCAWEQVAVVHDDGAAVASQSQPIAG